MSTFAVTVIDTACEAADQTFFPPKVSMTTKSTTRIAKVIGFPEYPGFESTPPKRYHTLTWTGFSEQQLFYLGTQIAGARFDYSGSSEIDTNGNYSSLYTKNLSTMCNAAAGLITSAVPFPLGGLEGFYFQGWLGPSGHQKCPPPGIPYTFFANEAAGKGDNAILDVSMLWGSETVNPTNSLLRVTKFLVTSSTGGQCTDTNLDPNAVGLICLFEPVTGPGLGQIDNSTQGTVWFFGGVVWNNNYASSLSNEYTDAEALGNAQTVTGNGSVAANFPRTTGFTSTFTTVVYTLNCTDLINGTNYNVTVDFWDSGTGIITTRTYQITGGGSGALSIVDSAPSPLPGHTLQVRNPRISFA